jgi:hypothetical protein
MTLAGFTQKSGMYWLNPDNGNIAWSTTGWVTRLEGIDDLLRKAGC